ncbi:MAG: hypothetical protein EA402_04345 [Planctomycetota bacterium]|nr:MAG: hypothetical protein EA402_04345 [Planctomycetota bacterium]
MLLAVPSQLPGSEASQRFITMVVASEIEVPDGIDGALYAAALRIEIERMREIPRDGVPAEIIAALGQLLLAKEDQARYYQKLSDSLYRLTCAAIFDREHADGVAFAAEMAEIREQLLAASVRSAHGLKALMEFYQPDQGGESHEDASADDQPDQGENSPQDQWVDEM